MAGGQGGDAGQQLLDLTSGQVHQHAYTRRKMRGGGGKKRRRKSARIG
jgi:hypothetical protein